MSVQRFAFATDELRITAHIIGHTPPVGIFYALRPKCIFRAEQRAVYPALEHRAKTKQAAHEASLGKKENQSALTTRVDVGAHKIARRVLRAKSYSDASKLVVAQFIDRKSVV